MFCIFILFRSCNKSTNKSFLQSLSSSWLTKQWSKINKPKHGRNNYKKRDKSDTKLKDPDGKPQPITKNKSDQIIPIKAADENVSHEEEEDIIQSDLPNNGRKNSIRYN